MFHRYNILLLWAVCYLAVACTPHEVREAQQTVAEADSIWLAGQSYGDSTRLAHAYGTLKKLSTVRQLSNDFARSCYHYGRLLRTHDNPAAAMQVFIHATHSSTRDYHILGRVYSNMGDLCHSADEYELAFAMYERSADMFLKNGDTLLYYYGLNNLAFEKAMIPDKEATWSLVDRVESQCTNADVLSKLYETKAELYLHVQQYDSAIYWGNKCAINEDDEPLGLLIKAQAYSYLSKKDSAVYYAKQVLSKSHKLSQINNAQYILTNDDESRDTEAVREVAADRSDTQKLLEIQYGEFSRAVQLLEQDIHRKPNFTWLYAIIATLLITAIVLFVFFWHRRKQHALLSQQRSAYSRKRKADLEINCVAFHNSKTLKKDLDWENYDSMCHIANIRFGGIAIKLKTFPNMTSGDIKLCVLVLLDLSYEDTAAMLNLSVKSIAKLKSITAKKLGVSMKNLRPKLIQIACSEDRN